MFLEVKPDAPRPAIFTTPKPVITEQLNTGKLHTENEINYILLKIRWGLLCQTNKYGFLTLNKVLPHKEKNEKKLLAHINTYPYKID